MKVVASCYAVRHLKTNFRVARFSETSCLVREHSDARRLGANFVAGKHSEARRLGASLLVASDLGASRPARKGSGEGNQPQQRVNSRSLRSSCEAQEQPVDGCREVEDGIDDNE